MRTSRRRAGGRGAGPAPGTSRCLCPVCLGEVRGRRWTRMRHTLVDLLRPRVEGLPDGHLRQTLQIDLAVDTEARRTWTRLGQ